MIWEKCNVKIIKKKQNLKSMYNSATLKTMEKTPSVNSREQDCDFPSGKRNPEPGVAGSVESYPQHLLRCLSHSRCSIKFLISFSLRFSTFSH